MKTLKNKKLLVSRETITSLNSQKLENLNNVLGGIDPNKFTGWRCVMTVVGTSCIGRC